MSRATIHDVARRAGVSVATVSRALRGHANVAPATRKRIRKIAAELDYAAHPQASRLASGRTMTVGLVAPLFGLWYAGQVVAGADEILAAAGYDLLVHSVDTPDNRARFFSTTGALRGRVDGLLLVDLFAAPEHVGALHEAGTPVVTIGERIEGFSSLTIDNAAAARAATHHIIELGHQRIGLIDGDPEAGDESPVPLHRTAGFQAALADAGLVDDAALHAGGMFSVEGGAHAVERLLTEQEPPTAVFCMSDEMAMGAIGRARELGCDVPGDLSVVGFDGHDLAHAFGLTTMSQPVRGMGKRATETLIAAIDGRLDAPRHERADVELVVRKSSSPPR